MAELSTLMSFCAFSISLSDRSKLALGLAIEETVRTYNIKMIHDTRRSINMHSLLYLIAVNITQEIDGCRGARSAIRAAYDHVV